MKAVLYNGPWDMSVVDLPAPEPGEGEALLRVDTVGICGSDVHGFTGESGRRAPGMVMGHEVSGTVERLGPGASAPAPGTRVALYNIIADHAPSPEEGDPSFLNKQLIGVNLGTRGAMAEYVAVPAANLIPLADGVPSEVGLLAEPLGVVLHGWHRLEARNVAPRRVAILGAGTIGMAGVLVARARGAERIASLDTIAAKARRAAQLGATAVPIAADDTVEDTRAAVTDALGEPPDVVVDAVGSAGSFVSAVRMVAEGGTVLMIGNLAHEVPLPVQDMISYEWTLVGTYGFDRRAFGDAVAMLGDLHRELSGFIEGRCTLDEVPEVMTSLAKGERQALKVVIDVAG